MGISLHVELQATEQLWSDWQWESWLQLGAMVWLTCGAHAVSGTCTCTWCKRFWSRTSHQCCVNNIPSLFLCPCAKEPCREESLCAQMPQHLQEHVPDVKRNQTEHKKVYAKPLDSKVCKSLLVNKPSQVLHPSVAVLESFKERYATTVQNLFMIYTTDATSIVWNRWSTRYCAE